MVMVAGDFWENFEGRLFLDLWHDLAVENGTIETPICKAPLLVGPQGYSCTRPPGHPGRHFARASSGIAAAWPGTLPPERDDLL